MAEFTVSKNALGKLSGGVVPPPEQECMQAIVQVEEPWYVPEGLTVRSRVDATMLTADFPVSISPVLQNDPKVTVISISRRLRLNEADPALEG